MHLFANSRPDRAVENVEKSFPHGVENDVENRIFS